MNDSVAQHEMNGMIINLQSKVLEIEQGTNKHLEGLSRDIGFVGQHIISLNKRISDLEKSNAQDKEYAMSWRIQQLTKLQQDAYKSTWYRRVLISMKTTMRIIK